MQRQQTGDRDGKTSDRRGRKRKREGRKKGGGDVSGRMRCLKTLGTLFEVFPFFRVYLSFGAG